MRGRSLSACGGATDTSQRHDTPGAIPQATSRQLPSTHIAPLDFRGGVPISVFTLMRISAQALLRLTSAHDL